jgi:hypothetical protein
VARPGGPWSYDQAVVAGGGIEIAHSGARRADRGRHTRWIRPSLGLVGLRLDLLLAVVLALSVLLLHDVGYLLRTPYWLDESWVAVSTKAPLHDLPRVSSSSPLGWTLLLRVVLVGGHQRARLLPLASAGLTAAAAYWLGREMKLPRAASCALGVVALMAPAMLIRDDLKQYTTEALVAMVVATLLVRAHRLRSRRAVVVLAAACVVALPIANATVFVGSAALLGLALDALLARDRGRLRDVVVAGVCVAALWGVWAATALRTARSPALVSYWDAYYPSRNPVHLASYLWHHLSLLSTNAGLDSAVGLVLVVVFVVVMLTLSQELPLAVLPLLVAVELVAAAELRLYPLLDARTSTWWLVLLPVLGFASLARLVQRPSSGRGRHWVVRAAGALLVAGCLAAYAASAAPKVRSHPIPAEDVRTQTQVVMAQRRPGDVVVVDYGASYAFAFYGGVPAPIRTHPSSSVGTGFDVTLPGPGLLALNNRTITGTEVAWTRALVTAELTPGAHIWLVRSHMSAAEAAAWRSILSTASVVRSWPDGLVEATAASATGGG